MEIMLPEIVSIGIYDTNIAVKNKTVTKNRKTTMFEIEIPTHHGGTSYIDSEHTSIHPNMLVCAKPGQMRHTRLPFRCYYVHMILHSGKLYEELNNTPNFIPITSPDKYYKIFKKMCAHFESGHENNEILLQSLLLELIHTLLSDSSKATFNRNAKSNNHEVIEKSIKYIKENLTSDLSLSIVSDYAGFSQIHFHNCFKASTGKTLRDFVEEQRIKKASNMLISTDKTLTQIAYECGFSSQSYFNYAFKRKTGLTPRAYSKHIYKRYEATE